MSTSRFVAATTDQGFGGDNNSVNKRLDSPFNQWTRDTNDVCGYVNQIRILRKPIKYYINRTWAPAPTNEREMPTFTAVGNQKAYFVESNTTFPLIGETTSQGNKRFIQYVAPLATSPDLGNNAIASDKVHINSTKLAFGFGEPTNLRNNPKEYTSAVDYNRWDFVEPSLVQNPEHIIFTRGVIPRGGIDTRNELRNFATVNNC